jgi:hypothetical protein
MRQVLCQMRQNNTGLNNSRQNKNMMINIMNTDALEEAFNAGYDYRSSLLPEIIAEFGENSMPDFNEWVRLNTQKQQAGGLPDEQDDSIKQLFVDKLLSEIKERDKKIKWLEDYIQATLPCNHVFVQKDSYWKSCQRCGMLAPLT